MSNLVDNDVVAMKAAGRAQYGLSVAQRPLFAVLRTGV